MTRVRMWMLAGAVLTLVLAGCGDDDGSGTGGDATADSGASTDADGADSATDDSSNAGDSSGGTAGSDDVSDSGGGDGSDDVSGSGGGDGSDDAAGSGGGATGGTLVIGDETISLDSSRCFMQEQDAVGGGKILFVAQAFGTTAAGDQLVLDVSRYDEDSQFAGDDVKVDIGDPFSEDAVSLSSISDIGTVTVEGSTLSAANLTFTNFDDFTDQSGSFEFSC